MKLAARFNNSLRCTGSPRIRRMSTCLIVLFFSFCLVTLAEAGRLRFLAPSLRYGFGALDDGCLHLPEFIQFFALGPPRREGPNYNSPSLVLLILLLLLLPHSFVLRCFLLWRSPGCQRAPSQLLPLGFWTHKDAAMFNSVHVCTALATIRHSLKDVHVKTPLSTGFFGKLYKVNPGYCAVCCVGRVYCCVCYMCC